jgi:hypothetical protein
MVKSLIIHGDWQTVTVDRDGTTSDEVDLGGEYRDVQLYNPELDSSTLTIQPTRLTGGTVVQAYSFNADATGDFDKTTTARTTAGMNVFVGVCARYVKVVCGAAQTAAERTFYARGIELISQR